MPRSSADAAPRLEPSFTVAAPRLESAFAVALRRLALVTALAVSLVTAVASDSNAQSSRTPPAPGLVFAFEMHVNVGAPVMVGQVPRGQRKVVPGGADWQIIRADGFSELDTRYTIETDKGQLIYVQNAGMRHAAPAVMEKLLKGETVDPKLVYFRTIPTFETAAPDLQWLTRSVFIGTGERYPTEVVIRFWRVE
jgi:Protein of unknown function (DUF3237)